MSFISRILRPAGRKDNPTLELFREIYGSLRGNTGKTINAQTALEVTTALRCTAAISDGVSTVPLKLLQRQGTSRVVANDHPLMEVLTEEPNLWQDSVTFRETLCFHTVLCGNAFAYINRVNGVIKELLPIEPRFVTVKRNRDMSLYYEIRLEEGLPVQIMPASVIWHIRGPSWNGWMGMEAVKMAREALGLALATEEAHARTYANGVMSSGAWAVEGTLDELQHKKLTAWVKEHYTGLANSGKPLILDRHAKWNPMSMSGVDAQHVETRRLQVEEVCRAFGVMPIMVGYSDKTSTYASAEQMFLAHAVHCIRPWHRRFEASIKRHLLTADERHSGLYPKFFDAELLRGAAKDRGDFYAKALGSGGSKAWAEVNEIRGWEDLDEVEWGKGEPIPPSSPKDEKPSTAEGPDDGQV